MRLSESARLREVGLRDGLQSRSVVVPTHVKAAIFGHLVEAGFKALEVVALVNPATMPQVGDSEEFLESVNIPGDVWLSGLVLNRRGLERGIALHERGRLDELHFLHATTDSVLAANKLPPDREVNFEEVVRMAKEAKEAGLRTAVFISASFGCSIEGPVRPDVPLGIGERLVSSGAVDEIVFSDSTGQAVPVQIFEFFSGAKQRLGGFPITAHFHDTRGAGLANLVALLDVGLDQLTIDVAFGGLGGDVPFLPEASGNLCTEDALCVLDGCGVKSGVDLAPVLEAVALAEAALEETLPSHVARFGRPIGRSAATA